MPQRESAPQGARTWVVILPLALAGMLAALQQTLVVPMLPEVPGIFGVGTDSGTWMVTVTLLTGAVATPIVSRMADMYGKRKMIILTMSMMIVGSLILALTNSFALAIGGRACQGLAAALIPVGISIMRDELPPEKVGFGVALMSATLGIGSALGLPLSGVLYQHFGWHSLFWVSAGVGALTLLGVLVFVKESRVKTPGRFDYIGAVVLSGALTAFLLAVSKGASWGWTSLPVVLLLAASVLLMMIWFPFELRVNDAMVDLRTTARRPVLLTNLASVLIAVAMYVNMLLTVTLLELPAGTGHGLGLEVSAAGLAMVPTGLIMVALSPFAGAILNRWGGRLTMAAGATIMSLSYLLRIPFSDNLTQVIIGSSMVGLGTALAFAAMPILIMAAVPITETAAANGINSLARAVGGATSSAIFAAVLASMTVPFAGEMFPSQAAFNSMFLLCAGATAAAVGVTLLIPARTSRGEGYAESVVPAERTGSEMVVRGTLHVGGEPPRQAVAIVTVTRLDGRPVDWARCDQDGNYAVAVPGPGKYLLVGNARGWSPHPQIITFVDGTVPEHISLERELTITGTVSDGGVPAAQALVALHYGGGEFVSSVTSDWQGRYRFPLPTAGPYVVTAASTSELRAGSRKVTVNVERVKLDIELSGDSSGRTAGVAR